MFSAAGGEWRLFPFVLVLGSVENSIESSFGSVREFTQEHPFSGLTSESRTCLVFSRGFRCIYIYLCPPGLVKLVLPLRRYLVPYLDNTLYIIIRSMVVSW